MTRPAALHSKRRTNKFLSYQLCLFGDRIDSISILLFGLILFFYPIEFLLRLGRHGAVGATRRQLPFAPFLFKSTAICNAIPRLFLYLVH